MLDKCRIVSALTAILLMIAMSSFATAHPGSGIVVDRNGQVFFCQTATCIWKIDTEGNLSRHHDSGSHWLALDSEGKFIGQVWPRYLESMRPGQIRFGDAEVNTVGVSPTVLTATSFPIAVDAEGNLFYPEPSADEKLHIKRLAPGERPTRFATIPVVEEIAPNHKPWKAFWIHGLAAAKDGSLYYTEKEAVRRIDTDGSVTMVAEEIKVPECEHGEDHRGGPILRGLDVAQDGSIYVAAMACQSVLRITPVGEISVALRATESWTPTGVAIKGDDVYVLEFWFQEPENASSWLPRVRKLSGDGTVTVLAVVTENSAE